MCTEESAASAASSEAQRAAAHQLQVVEHEPGAALQRLLHLSIHRLVQLRRGQRHYEYQRHYKESGCFKVSSGIITHASGFNRSQRGVAWRLKQLGFERVHKKCAHRGVDPSRVQSM